MDKASIRIPHAVQTDAKIAKWQVGVFMALEIGKWIRKAFVNPVDFGEKGTNLAKHL